MVNYEEEESFFEQGFKMIYNWLSVEERYDFDNEMSSEENQFDLYKSWEEKFYRALNYIQIKYVNIEKYLLKIEENFLKITSHEDESYNDIVFIDNNEESFYLSDIKKIVYELKPESSFNDLLEQLEIKEKYHNFMDSEKYGKWEGWRKTDY